MTALPDGWADITLGELVQPRSERADSQTLGDMPFVGMDQVEPSTTKLRRTRSVSELKSAVALFRKGDILYGRLRPHLNKVHYAEFDGAASAEFHRHASWRRRLPALSRQGVAATGFRSSSPLNGAPGIGRV